MLFFLFLPVTDDQLYCKVANAYAELDVIIV
jgi:hypothetical protein